MTIQLPDIDALVRQFTVRLVEAAEAQARGRILAALAGDPALLDSHRPAGSIKHGAEGSAALKARRTPRLSAKTLAIRRLQGQYLGLLRGLAPGARARVKRMAKEKGVAAAVALGNSLK